MHSRIKEGKNEKKKNERKAVDRTREGNIEIKGIEREK